MVWHKKPPTPIWRHSNISSHYLYPVFWCWQYRKVGRVWQNWQMTNGKVFRTKRQIAHSINYTFNTCLTASPTTPCSWSRCSEPQCTHAHINPFYPYWWCTSLMWDYVRGSLHFPYCKQWKADQGPGNKATSPHDDTKCHDNYIYLWLVTHVATHTVHCTGCIASTKRVSYRIFCWRGETINYG